MAVHRRLHIRCFVRSPDKIPAEQRGASGVEVVEDNLWDSDAVAVALEGAQRVICVGGGPSNHQPGMR